MTAMTTKMMTTGTATAAVGVASVTASCIGLSVTTLQPQQMSRPIDYEFGDN